jgi:hypothetical protein
MLCLVQIVDGQPRGHTVAKDLRHLLSRMPEGYPFEEINAKLAAVREEPKGGQYDFGDAYWLLVSER